MSKHLKAIADQMLRMMQRSIEEGHMSEGQAVDFLQNASDALAEDLNEWEDEGLDDDDEDHYDLIGEEDD